MLILSQERKTIRHSDKFEDDFSQIMKIKEIALKTDSLPSTDMNPWNNKRGEQRRYVMCKIDRPSQESSVEFSPDRVKEREGD